MNKYLAESFGTAFLVIIGCGSAVLAGSHIGFLGVSLSFGFALLLLAYLLGPISGCHLNPAVTLCLFITKKFPGSDVLPYIVAQIIGGIVGGYYLFYIAHGQPGFSLDAGFACNGFGEHSPGGYSMASCFLTEVLMTEILLLAVLATTRQKFSTEFTGIFVGLTLAAVHLVSIPVTNTSVNFARSVGVAVVHGGWAIHQLWLFAAAQVVAVIFAIIVWKLIETK